MDLSARLPRNFFARDALYVARALIGATLLVDGIGGVICETEAYDGLLDPACHGFKGLTERCRSLFARPGTLYVYRIHRSFCMNIATNRKGHGAGVLIRGIVPTIGVDRIAQRRGHRPRREWCNGPGKVTSALAVDLRDDGLDLIARESRTQVLQSLSHIPDEAIRATSRVGISKAQELPWRFVVAPEFVLQNGQA